MDREGAARVGSERIHASSVLGTVYQRRGYKPVWADETKLLGNAETLLYAIGRAAEHGLDPLDYHYDQLINLRLAVEHRGLPS